MKEMNLYHNDLNDEAQARFNERFGPPEDFNHDDTPLFIYQQED